MNKKITAVMLLIVMITAIVSMAAFADVVYPAHVGQNEQYRHGCGRYLTFGAKASPDDYVKMLIDDSAITAFCFKDNEGFTRVDLKPEYVDTLRHGNHTAVLVFKNGVSETINFTILKPEVDQYGRPVTGDESNVTLWATLLVLSSAAACTAVLKLRKEH